MGLWSVPEEIWTMIHNKVVMPWLFNDYGDDDDVDGELLNKL